MRDYTPRRGRNPNRHWFSGLLLIGIGGLFLLDNFALMDGGSVLQYWPFILAIFGVGRIVDARNSRQVARGGFMVFLAFWLYASIENLWGLSFENSWPLVLIAWGLRHIFVGLASKRELQSEERS